MGYESKIYFCRRYNIPDFDKERYKTGEIIASIDMCKMGYSDPVRKFLDLFDTEVDFAIHDEFVSDSYTTTVEDCYGDHLCYGDITKLRKQMKKILDNEEATGNRYWRFYILYDMLNTFENNSDGDIYVVHFGY